MMADSKRSNSSIVVSQSNTSIPQNDFSQMLYSNMPVYTEPEDTSNNRNKEGSDENNSEDEKDDLAVATNIPPKVTS